MNKSHSSLARWCLLALALLVPGSFFILPLLWLRWNRGQRAATTGTRAS